MAMSAAAPPPTALNSDTSCGIAVIFTVRAVYRPAPPPTATPTDDDPQALALMPSPISCCGEDEDGGGADGEGHAAGRDEVAVAGGGRRVHPHQADDERDGAQRARRCGRGLR